MADMNRHDILAAVNRAGKNWTILAAEHGYSGPAAFSKNMLHWPPDHPIAVIIAATIEMPLHVIWPSRYRADGSIIACPRTPNGKARRRKRNRAPRSCQTLLSA